VYSSSPPPQGMKYITNNVGPGIEEEERKNTLLRIPIIHNQLVTNIPSIIPLLSNRNTPKAIICATAVYCANILATRPRCIIENPIILYVNYKGFSDELSCS